MNNRLSDKVAFITGGGSWIGKEIANVFAAHEAKVCIVGRDLEKLKQTVNEIKRRGGSATYFSADISNEAAIKSAVNHTLSEFGKIDILVQNAGIYPSSMIENMALSEWKNVIDVNLTGSFIVLKAISSSLKKQSEGRMIFISSIAGEEMGNAGLAHYTASKAGINGLMRTAALEFAKYNVTVNSIGPGNILNKDVFQVNEAQMADMLKNIPLGRVGQPLDVANMALFLASNESSFITGQHFVVDGGETIA